MTTTKKRATTRKRTRTTSSLGAAERFRQVNLIADPLYGYIEITKDRPGEASERQLLDTVWLQRLRRVHQQLADVIGSLRASPTDRFSPGEQIDPMWVAWVMADADIAGYSPPGWLRALKPILCGPATADNLDYVPRDAYMCGISLGAVEVQRLIHYTFVSGDSIVLHAHAAGALEMFLASRLYMYLQVYHHRTGRRFDLSMREIFADTIAQLLHGNPLEHLDEYELLNDWSVLVAVQRWQREPLGTERRRLADAWARIAARDLPWHLAYESIVHKGTDTSTLQQRLDAALASKALGARVEVDVAIARIAPQNPMTDDGMVRIYDPLNDTIEAARAAELVARLPQHNQVIRVFIDDVSALRTVRDAVKSVIAG